MIEVRLNDFGYSVSLYGNSDCSSVIQAALDDIETAGGGQLILPPGKLLLCSGVRVNSNNVSIEGAGVGVTQIICTFNTDDIFKIGSSSTNINNINICNMSITSTVQRTIGGALGFYNGHNITAKNLRIDNNMYAAFVIEGGPQQFGYFIENIEASSNYYAIIVGQSKGVQDLWVSKCIFGGSSKAGMLLFNISGLYLNSIDLIGCVDGITTYPQVGQSVGALWAHTVLADTCSNNGWNIITAGGSVIEWTLDSCWASTCTNNGMYINGDVKGISSTGFRAINNGKTGILASRATQLSFVNTNCFANSQSQVGGYNGIEIGPDVRHWSIVGGFSGKGGQFPMNNQKYGLFINYGTRDFIVSSLNTQSNQLGGIYDGSGEAANKQLGLNI